MLYTGQWIRLLTVFMCEVGGEVLFDKLDTHVSSIYDYVPVCLLTDIHMHCFLYIDLSTHTNACVQAKGNKLCDRN